MSPIRVGEPAVKIDAPSRIKRIRQGNKPSYKHQVSHHEDGTRTARRTRAARPASIQSGTTRHEGDAEPAKAQDGKQRDEATMKWVFIGLAAGAFVAFVVKETPSLIREIKIERM